MTTSQPARPETGQETAWRVWAAMSDLVLGNARRREVSDALGMSFGRVRALRRIARSPVTMRDLAACLQIDAPYATVVIDELERRGLVRRRPHPTDRRAKLVSATPRGVAAAARADRILGEPPAGLAALPAESIAQLARILAEVDAAARG